MTIKEARILAGFTQKEVEDLFGISHRTLQNQENADTAPSWLKEMLIREFLREPVDSAGRFALVRNEETTPEELIRFHSLADAEHVLRNLAEGKVCYGTVQKEISPERWSIWECSSEWVPVKKLADAVSEKKQGRIPEWVKEASKKRKEYQPAERISKDCAEEICQMYISGATQADIISALNVSGKTIRKVLEKNALIMPTEVRVGVRERLRNGETPEDIAATYGISTEAVIAVSSRIKGREARNNIQDPQ